MIRPVRQELFYISFANAPSFGLGFEPRRPRLPTMAKPRIRRLTRIGCLFRIRTRISAGPLRRDPRFRPPRTV